MKNETTNRPLMRYDTADFLRLATPDEAEASDKAMAGDGGVGAISVEINGKDVTCYVPAEED